MGVKDKFGKSLRYKHESLLNNITNDLIKFDNLDNSFLFKNMDHFTNSLKAGFIKQIRNKIVFPLFVKNYYEINNEKPKKL